MHQQIHFYNVYDGHYIIISDFQEVMVIEENAWECVVNDFRQCLQDELSPISGNVNLPKNEIKIKIDRPVKDEELIGGFYTITLKDNGAERKDNFFIAFSGVTARQYLFSINDSSYETNHNDVSKIIEFILFAANSISIPVR
jgi:hypothetical protein